MLALYLPYFRDGSNSNTLINPGSSSLRWIKCVILALVEYVQLMCLFCYYDTEKAITEKQIEFEIMVFSFVFNKLKSNGKLVFIY